jgi:hypothetical protein
MSLTRHGRTRRHFSSWRPGNRPRHHANPQPHAPADQRWPLTDAPPYELPYLAIAAIVGIFFRAMLCWVSREYVMRRWLLRGNGAVCGLAFLVALTFVVVGSATASAETWSPQEPPSPTSATESYLNSVSCTSSEECIAVGWFESLVSETETAVPLAEKWNGTAWSAQEPPAPAGAKESDLYGVSCASSTECTAVGEFDDSSNEGVPLAEKWNGTAWSAQEPPAPTGG